MPSDSSGKANQRLFATALVFLLASLGTALVLPISALSAGSGGGGQKETSLQLDAARTAFLLGRTTRSREILEKVTRLNPENSEAWLLLGNTRLALRDFQGAEASYRRAIELAKNRLPIASYFLARSLQAQGRSSDAIELLRSLRHPEVPEKIAVLAEKAASQQISRLLKRGSEKFAAEEYVDAIRNLEIVSRFEPSTEVSLLLAVARVRVGDTAEASTLLEQVIRTQPGSAWASEAVARLSELGERNRQSGPWIAMEAAGGYNSNVRSTGPDVPLLEHAFTNGQLGLGYAWRLASLSLELAVLGQIEEIIGIPAERYAAISPSVGVSLELNRGWTARASGHYRVQFLSNASYLNRPGLELGLLFERERHRVSLGINFEQILPQDANYRYLGGRSYGLDLTYERAFASASVSFSLGVMREAIGDLISAEARTVLPLANFSRNGTFELRWSASDQWNLLVRGSLQWKEYPTLSEPGRISRIDRLIESNFRLERQLPGGMRGFAEAGRLWNASTLSTGTASDRNFYRNRLAGGITWNLGP